MKILLYFKLRARDLWKDMMSYNVSYRQRRQYSGDDGSDTTGPSFTEEPGGFSRPPNYSGRESFGGDREGIIC